MVTTIGSRIVTCAKGLSSAYASIGAVIATAIAARAWHDVARLGDGERAAVAMDRIVVVLGVLMAHSSPAFSQVAGIVLGVVAGLLSFLTIISTVVG